MEEKLANTLMFRGGAVMVASFVIQSVGYHFEHGILLMVGFALGNIGVGIVASGFWFKRAIKKEKTGKGFFWE